MDSLYNISDMSYISADCGAGGNIIIFPTYYDSENYLYNTKNNTYFMLIFGYGNSSDGILKEFLSEDAINLIDIVGSRVSIFIITDNICNYIDTYRLPSNIGDTYFELDDIDCILLDNDMVIGINIYNEYYNKTITIGDGIDIHFVQETTAFIQNKVDSNIVDNNDYLYTTKIDSTTYHGMDYDTRDLIELELIGGKLYSTGKVICVIPATIPIPGYDNIVPLNICSVGNNIIYATSTNIIINNVKLRDIGAYRTRKPQCYNLYYDFGKYFIFPNFGIIMSSSIVTNVFVDTTPTLTYISTDDNTTKVVSTTSTLYGGGNYTVDGQYTNIKLLTTSTHFNIVDGDLIFNYDYPNYITDDIFCSGNYGDIISLNVSTRETIDSTNYFSCYLRYDIINDLITDNKIFNFANGNKFWIEYNGYKFISLNELKNLSSTLLNNFKLNVIDLGLCNNNNWSYENDIITLMGGSFDEIISTTINGDKEYLTFKRDNLTIYDTVEAYPIYDSPNSSYQYHSLLYGGNPVASTINYLQLNSNMARYFKLCMVISSTVTNDIENIFNNHLEICTFDDCTSYYIDNNINIIDSTTITGILNSDSTTNIIIDYNEYVNNSVTLSINQPSDNQRIEVNKNIFADMSIYDNNIINFEIDRKLYTIIFNNVTKTLRYINMNDYNVECHSYIKDYSKLCKYIRCLHTSNVPTFKPDMGLICYNGHPYDIMNDSTFVSNYYWNGNCYDQYFTYYLIDSAYDAKTMRCITCVMYGKLHNSGGREIINNAINYNAFRVNHVISTVVDGFYLYIASYNYNTHYYNISNYSLNLSYIETDTLLSFVNFSDDTYASNISSSIPYNNSKIYVGTVVLGRTINSNGGGTFTTGTIQPTKTNVHYISNNGNSSSMGYPKPRDVITFDKELNIDEITLLNSNISMLRENILLQRDYISPFSITSGTFTKMIGYSYLYNVPISNINVKFVKHDQFISVYINDYILDIIYSTSGIIIKNYIIDSNKLISDRDITLYSTTDTDKIDIVRV